MRQITIALCLTIICSVAYGQNGCAKDDLGRIFCAPAGGSAVKTMNGVACALGRCVTDNLGYLKCSSQLGGAALKDDLGRPVCVGGCVNPTAQYCQQLTTEKK